MNNIYTIPVGGYSQNGAPAYYDERCGAKFTVAYVDNTLSSTLQVVCVCALSTLSLPNTFFLLVLSFTVFFMHTIALSVYLSLEICARPHIIVIGLFMNRWP